MTLAVRDLTKHYGKKIAVRPLNITLTPGIYGLLGPNGAGKSTLMNMLADVIQPTAGMVACDGIPIWELGAKYRRRLGYLPQHTGLYPHFTGKEMLMYMACLKGEKSRKKAAAQADEWLERVNLSEDGKRKIRQYSGGMKQRLAIAQALLGRPELLIFDEPTAGLDPKERIRFKNILAELAETSIILLSTHIVSDIEDVADRVLLMKEGSLIENGTPDECLDTVRGKVWTVTVSAAQADRILAVYPAAHVEHKGTEVEIRTVSDAPPADGESLSVEPCLDDLYMYHFGQEEKP